MVFTIIYDAIIVRLSFTMRTIWNPLCTPSSWTCAPWLAAENYTPVILPLVTDANAWDKVSPIGQRLFLLFIEAGWQ
jgi:hypothetical protein